MNFGFPFTPFGTPDVAFQGNQGNYTGNMPAGFEMPTSGTGCGCGVPQVNNVVNKCFVEDVPYYVNYHTHQVNNVVRRHIQVPTYSCSEQTVYYDEWPNSCGCSR